MKRTITISMDSARLKALEQYLKNKNVSLSDELNKSAEGLYQKYVPQTVREYIDFQTADKKGKPNSEP